MYLLIIKKLDSKKTIKKDYRIFKNALKALNKTLFEKKENTEITICYYNTISKTYSNLINKNIEL